LLPDMSILNGSARFERNELSRKPFVIDEIANKYVQLFANAGRVYSDKIVQLKR
jgi:hypothetical protein